MIAPGRSEKQNFRFRRPTVGIAFEDKTANFFCTGGAAGLSRELNVAPGRAQAVGQKLRLGGFTRPVNTFKRDEPPGQEALGARNCRIRTCAAVPTRTMKPPTGTS